MTNFDHDDLPPDLSELGRRMRDEQPVAEDGALDRMMQRAHTPSRQAPRRARKRVFATSFATMVAMVTVTGVAAAALFGGFGSLGSALTNSNRTVGTASSQALQPSRLGSTIGSAAGSLGNLTGSRNRRPSGGGTSALAPSTGSALGGGVSASNHQYGGRRLICRILNALGLNFVARILGCPPV